jgi:hypothetical protein
LMYHPNQGLLQVPTGLYLSQLLRLYGASGEDAINRDGIITIIIINNLRVIYRL